MLQCAKEKFGPVSVPHDPEYLALVADILEHPDVLSMEQYTQHGETTCLRHSLNVSYLSYLYCRDHGLDVRAVARGGLLHDLFLYDWHLYRRQPGERLHGFEPVSYTHLFYQNGVIVTPFEYYQYTFSLMHTQGACEKSFLRGKRDFLI